MNPPLSTMGCDKSIFVAWFLPSFQQQQQQQQNLPQETRPETRASFLGVQNAVIASAFVIGPAVGGWLVGEFGIFGSRFWWDRMGTAPQSHKKGWGPKPVKDGVINNWKMALEIGKQGYNYTT